MPISYQQILQQSVQLRQLQVLAAGDVASLLQQTQRLVQRAHIEYDVLLLGGEEHVHVGHVLWGALVAAGHDQDAAIDTAAKRLLPLQAGHVA